MPNFIRNYIAGGTYFFTLVTSKRTRFFEDKRCVEAFFASLYLVQSYHHFDLIAYCILPDHIHLLITLAEADYNFSSRIKEIKRKTTTSIRKVMERPNIDVWQGRFWEHTIKDQDDLQHCFDYIHYNPIKHGYSDTFNWEWSSYWSYYGKDEHAAPVIDPKDFHEGMYSYGE